MQWFLVIVGLGSWLFAGMVTLVCLSGQATDSKLIVAAVMGMHGTLAFIGLAMLNRMAAMAGEKRNGSRAQVVSDLDGA